MPKSTRNKRNKQKTNGEQLPTTPPLNAMQNRWSHHSTLSAVKAAVQCSSGALGASRRLDCCGFRSLDHLLVVIGVTVRAGGAEVVIHHLADILGREDEGIDGAPDGIAARAVLDRLARRKD
jgi:hypothetical protein